MSLRTKLILLLTSIVIAVALTSSSLVYLFASERLEQRAKQRLAGTAVLLAEAIQLRFDTELRKFEYWAAMPLVSNTVLHYKDPKTRAAFDKYFSAVVTREPYSSIYLIDKKGECIASDDPRRLFHPHCPKVVSKRPSAVAGYAGTANIGRTVVGVADDRPVVTLTAPVRHLGKVVAILRAGVDLGRFGQEVLALHTVAPKEKVYFLDPSLPSSSPKSLKIRAPANWMNYSPPPKELRAAFEKRSESIFRYRDSEGEHLVAFAQLRAPRWSIVVSQPMAIILAPVRFLGKITLIVVALTIALLIVSVFLLTAPVVKRIERCREFSGDICRGRLERRLPPGPRDEVGDLARDLNEMAVRLEENFHDIAEAERKYRGIFENSVEGIFQTNRDGIMLAANPRLAEMLRAANADDLVGRSSLDFYVERDMRGQLLDRLRSEGEVSGFECEMVRMDGARLQALLHARAELDDQGGINVIHGSVEDVTELREAEAKARRTREAEDLLLRTKLEMLRYQVNPHFLFNTLNSIREMVLTDPDGGVEMIEALAGFYHSSLTHRSELLTTVSDEFDRIANYLQIQEIRFGDQMETAIRVDAAAEQVFIPVFLGQPIVENAVKYGRRSGARPLKIQISAHLEGDKCLFIVANTGHWFEPDQAGHGPGTQLGLEYVQRCLAHHYGSDAAFDIREEDGWVIARIVFPARPENPNA
ncbi:MAG: histidine kinase [Desulfarculaceae bacterium]|nr:histidine kinase [Desulfarculaceae bacterium]